MSEGLKNKSVKVEFYNVSRPMKAVVADVFTLLIYGLMVYVGHGSKFFTLISGCLFLFFLMFRLVLWMKLGGEVFSSKAEILAWANKLPDDPKF